jgi:hypothetical protein
MSRAASLMAILPVYQLIDFIDIYQARLQISIEYTPPVDTTIKTFYLTTATYSNLNHAHRSKSHSLPASQEEQGAPGPDEHPPS